MENKIEYLPSITLSTRHKDLTGKKQGKLIFIKPSQIKNNRVYWWVQCECGEIEEKRNDSPAQACSKCLKKEQGKKIKGKNMSDLSNQRFGKLIALYPLEERKANKILWHCKCDCGNEIDVYAASLTSKNTLSCGCLRKEKANFKKNSTDLTGKVFGYLTVLEKTAERQYGKIVWKCQCECGKIVYLNTSRLNNGNDTSCGCKKSSLGAIKIENIFKANNILYKKEYTNTDLKSKRFDFAIIENDKIIRLVEFDGEQHYRTSGGWNNLENLKLTKERDQKKNEYALTHNIPLVRIPYWERDNITLEMIMGDQYLIK